MLPVGEHLDWLNWSGKTYPMWWWCHSMNQSHQLSISRKGADHQPHPCGQPPQAPAAKPSPLWWTVSPHTASPNKLFFTLIASFRLFGHSYYVTCIQVICELCVLSCVGSNEVHMKERNRKVHMKETGRRCPSDPIFRYHTTKVEMKHRLTCRITVRAGIIRLARLFSE